LVDVSVADANWSQSGVTFNTLPQITNPPVASAAVYGANVWYSWDITPAVISKSKDGVVGLAIGLRTLENKGEEQVVFASSDAGRNAPRLLVTMAPVAPSVPLYALPAGVVAAALLAFGGGLLIGRRRRARRPVLASAVHAVPTGKASLSVEDLQAEATKDCPQCRRQIPADAEQCPRCGARLSAQSTEALTR
jgi:hypothetical protein